MSGSISGLQGIAGDIAGAINNNPSGSSQSNNALQFLADLVSELQNGGGGGSGASGGSGGAGGQGGIADLVSEIVQALEGGGSSQGSGASGGSGGIGDILGGVTSMLGGGSSGSGSSGGSDTMGQIGKIAGEVLPIAAMFL